VSGTRRRCGWRLAIEALLRLRVTNASTEGTNRVIKQFKRVGCGYRNQGNYERRIVLHVAAKSGVTAISGEPHPRTRRATKPIGGDND
jgi:transposase